MSLETPALAELRRRISAQSSVVGSLTVDEVVGDVRTMHADPQSAGALSQVASQFNLLEMISPSAKPEDGVTIYADDPTQRAACAIAAGPGTIFRNYFANVAGRAGQSAKHQIDCLQLIGAALGNRREELWSVRNGNALASEHGLHKINSTLAEMGETERDLVRASLMVGLQKETEVTWNDCGHLVTQVYCSALPVAYSGHPPELWEQSACIVLEATYEATLAAATLKLCDYRK